MLLSALISLLLVGLILLAIGVRGRRIDDHPICRRCGFDLSGSPGRIPQCTECGAELDRPRAIRIGHRRKRTVVLAVGVLATVIGGGGLGIVGYTVARGIDPVTLFPSWWLARDAGRSDDWARRAINELIARANASKLSVSHEQALLEAILRWQADPNLPWSESWGDFVEAARMSDALSDEQWASYARNAVVVQFEARPQVRVGQMLPYRFNLARRIGSSYSFFFRFWLTEARAGDKQWNWPMERLGWSGAGFYGSMGVLSVGSSALLEDAPLGKHEVAFVFHFGLSEAGAERSAAAEDDAPLVEWTQTFTLPVTFTAADQPIVTITDDDSVREQIELAVSIEPVQIETRNGKQTATCTVNLDHPPLALAFDVLLQQAGREWRFGSVSAEARQQMSHGLYADKLDGFDPDGEFAVVLRSSVAAAERTIELVEIWQGEIVREGVVKRK